MQAVTIEEKIKCTAVLNQQDEPVKKRLAEVMCVVSLQIKLPMYRSTQWHDDTVSR